MGQFVSNGHQSDDQSTISSRQRRASAEDQKPRFSLHPDDDVFQLQHECHVQFCAGSI